MSNKREIKKREKLKQGKDGKYKCPHYNSCKKKYKAINKGAVYTHVSRDHKKQSEVIKAVKNYMCECNKRYFRKADLIYHQKQKGHQDPEIITFEADVRDTEEWIKLRQWAKQKYDGKLFDVIMQDPPHPDTCYNLQYDVMTDQEIMNVPIDIIQDKGFIFLWTTNAKRELCETYLKGRGYKIATYVDWLKTDDGDSLIRGLGRYFSHCKEECIVGYKGDIQYLQEKFNLQKIRNAFIDIRRLGSQKPKKIYEMIEEFCPGGKFIDVYGRWINRRQGWVLFGNEAKQMKDIKSL